MLEWLAAITDRVFSVFPRLLLVQQTHRAVKFTGSKAKELGPGLHIWWPLISEVEEIPVARQTVNLDIQVLVTKDGKTLAVGGVVVYSIKSAIDAIVRNYDHDETLSDVSMTAITEVVVNHTFDELMAALRGGTLERELTKRARRRLKAFGFKVDRCALTDITPCRAIRLLS